MTHARSWYPSLLVLALSLVPPAAQSVQPTNFQVRNNADLVALCATPTTDPNYVAAIHFCHGVGVGIVRYHEALQEGKDFDPIFCLPTNVTRSQAVSEYVRYSKAHPDYDRDLVGDVMLKFLSDTYPCSKAVSAAKP